MNRTRFNFFPRFCMDQAGDGQGGAAGAPAKATAATTSNDSASATAGTTAGDAAKASSDQNSAAAAVPAGVGQDGGDKGAAPDFKASLGEFGKDPAVATIGNAADLAKAFIETKKLVGQKLGIPGADATPEAREAFYTALGVPKDTAGYDFKQPDNLPEALKASYSQEHADKWAGIMKKHNIPKEAASALRQELFAEVTAEVGEMKAEVEKSDKQFAELARSIYGDDAKANTALQAARTMIEKHLPAPLKEALNQLSNTALLAVAAAVSGETKALTGEDRTIGTEGAGASGKTISQLREEAREMQKLPEYSSPFTPKGKTAHEDLVKKVKDIYSQINQMMAGGAKA
jgi:hypothetical protein